MSSFISAVTFCDTHSLSHTRTHTHTHTNTHSNTLTHSTIHTGVCVRWSYRFLAVAIGPVPSLKAPRGPMGAQISALWLGIIPDIRSLMETLPRPPTPPYHHRLIISFQEPKQKARAFCFCGFPSHAVSSFPLVCGPLLQTEKREYHVDGVVQTQ